MLVVTEAKREHRMKVPDLKDLYKIAIEGHEHDSTRFWNVFNVWSAINGGLLAVAIARWERRPDLDVLIIIFGFCAAVFWTGLQRRFAYFVNCYKLRRARLAHYYYTAILEMKADECEVDIPEEDLRLILTENHSDHIIAKNLRRECDSTPRYFVEPCPEHLSETAESDPNFGKTNTWLRQVWRGVRRVRVKSRKLFGTMAIGVWTPVVVGAVWFVLGVIRARTPFTTP